MSQLIPITPAQAQMYNNPNNPSNAALQQPGVSLQSTQANIANTQAQIPGTTAESGIKQVQQQAANYPLALQADLGKSMTLPDAMKKYSSLMPADAVFKQYLSQSPLGLPAQTPTELQNMGVTSDALGQIGIPGSFMDRYNTRNALTELRGLHDTWNQTDLASHIPFLAGADSTGRAYQSQKQVVGEHLSSLVPGASSSQGSNQGFLNALPNSGDLFAPGGAEGQFNKVEQALLQSKGYSYKDLGLSVPTPPAKASGGDLLNYLTKTASNVPTDTKNILNGILDTPANMIEQVKQDPMNSILNPMAMIANMGKNYLRNLNKDLGTPLQGGDVLNRIGLNFQNRPVSTILDVLPFLAAGKASLLSKAGDVGDMAGGADAAATLPSTTGNPIMDFLNPKGVVSRGGNFRSAVIDQATKAGATINGDAIVADLQKTASTLKQGNLGQGDIIDQSLKDAEQAFTGKKLTPQEAASAYAEADPGFTAKGIPKSAIQSNIDRNLRDVLGNHLQQVAPGWDEGTNIMAKGYQAQKSPVRGFAKRAGAVGLGIAGLDSIRHVLGL